MISILTIGSLYWSSHSQYLINRETGYSNVLFLLHLLLLASERYASFLPLCLLLQAAVFLRAHNSHVLWWPSGRVIINIKIAADESGLFAVISNKEPAGRNFQWMAAAVKTQVEPFPNLQTGLLLYSKPILRTADVWPCTHYSGEERILEEFRRERGWAFSKRQLHTFETEKFKLFILSRESLSHWQFLTFRPLCIGGFKLRKHLTTEQLFDRKGVNICPKNLSAHMGHSKTVCPEKDRQAAFYSPLWLNKTKVDRFLCRYCTVLF